jgi:hypothetical protein
MAKLIAVLVILAASLPVLARSEPWHMVPDEVNAGVPIKGGFVIGAVPESSIRRDGPYAEARVAMFYAYDLIQAAIAQENSGDEPFRARLQAALASGRANTYVGMERSFTNQGGTLFYLDMSDDKIRAALLAQEILVDQGYSPISMRTVEIKCKSRLDFEYRYAGDRNWILVGMPRNGSGSRGELLPFVCDRLGMGQNTPVPPPRVADLGPRVPFRGDIARWSGIPPLPPGSTSYETGVNTTHCSGADAANHWASFWATGPTCQRWLATLAALGRQGPTPLQVHGYRVSECWRRAGMRVSPDALQAAGQACEEMVSQLEYEQNREGAAAAAAEALRHSP